MPAATPRRSWIAATLIACATLAPTALPGHEGPEHEIEELSARMEIVGESADLLIERAVEYSILRRYPEAIRDLERSLQLNPQSTHAYRELARIQSATGSVEAALATLNRGLRLPADAQEPVDRASLLVLRAECSKSRREFRQALSDCDLAIRLHDANPEWYLLRADLQRRLRLHRKRIAGLEVGFDRTGAGILKLELVEALLDARRFHEALQKIDPLLAASRVQDRWLVRRGRARLGLGERSAAEADLTLALSSLNRRLDPSRPDAALLLDQATAAALLKRPNVVQECLVLAREKGGDPDITERIAELLPEKPTR